MCLPPANARIWPNPLLYSAVYHRYSLKSFQLCKSAQTYRYRKYFEHIVAGSKEILAVFAKIDSTQSLLERDCATCAVYLRENIQPLLSRTTHFAHAGLARNVLTNL